jgi:hypothetical protein
MNGRFIALATLALVAACLVGACSNGPASITGGLGPAGQGADKPRLAMNQLGNAFVVWEQDSSVGTDIASNSHVPVAGFGAVEFLTRNGSARDGDVAMNLYSKDAVAVWAEEVAGDWRVYASRYDDGTKQWRAAVVIAAYSDPGNGATSPRVAMDADGNATAVWTRRWGSSSEPAHYGVYTSNSMVADGGDVWTAPVRLDRAEAEGLDAWSPAIAMNEDGEAVVTFLYFTVSPRTPPPGREIEEIHACLYAVPFDGGDRVWSAPIHIGDETYGVFWGSNRVAIDARGDAFAVWQESGAQSIVLVNRFLDDGGGFQGPESPQVGSGDATAPDIANDVYSGRWVMVWEEDDATGASSIYARRYQDGDWLPQDLLETSDLPAATPRVAMGIEIGVMVVWAQEDSSGVDSLFSSGFRPSSGWSPPESAEDDSEKARTPVLDMDGFGAAIVAWVRDDGSNTDIWANTYAPDSGWGSASAR